MQIYHENVLNSDICVFFYVRYIDFENGSLCSFTTYHPRNWLMKNSANTNLRPIFGLSFAK